MHDPYYHPRNSMPPADFYWVEPPRRRRLNRKGMIVLFVLFALLLGLLLGALKLGFALWHSPVAAQATQSAARIGTVAADAAMEHYKVPKDLREVVKKEATLLQNEVFETPRHQAQTTPASGGTSALEPNKAGH